MGCTRYSDENDETWNARRCAYERKQAKSLMALIGMVMFGLILYFVFVNMNDEDNMSDSSQMQLGETDAYIISDTSSTPTNKMAQALRLSPTEVDLINTSRANFSGKTM